MRSLLSWHGGVHRHARYRLPSSHPVHTHAAGGWGRHGHRHGHSAGGDARVPGSRAETRARGCGGVVRRRLSVAGPPNACGRFPNRRNDTVACLLHILVYLCGRVTGNHAKCCGLIGGAAAALCLADRRVLRLLLLLLLGLTVPRALRTLSLLLASVSLSATRFTSLLAPERTSAGQKWVRDGCSILPAACVAGTAGKLSNQHAVTAPEPDHPSIQDPLLPALHPHSPSTAARTAHP